MEFIFVLVVLGITSIAIALVLLVVAGISALLGASFRSVFLHGLWALALPPIFILHGWLIGRNQITVNRLEIHSVDIPASFDGYRIVHISDLHLRSFKNRSRILAGTVDKINAEKADLIVFTGDLVTYRPDEIPPFEKILSGLTANDGVISVMGNHDYCPYNDWKSESERRKAVEEVRAMEKVLGWQLIDNANITIRRSGPHGTDSISVIGVENISAMKQFETYGDLGKAMSGASGNFKILLSHDPTHWRAEVLGRTDIDLTLSGHTHNAQCRILGLEPSRLVFRENSGLYSSEALPSSAVPEHGPHHISGRTQYLYVNDGLGETMFPARIGVPAEITVLILRSM